MTTKIYFSCSWVFRLVWEACQAVAWLGLVGILSRLWIRLTCTPCTFSCSSDQMLPGGCTSPCASIEYTSLSRNNRYLLKLQPATGILSSWSTFHWPKQVTWPNPTSMGQGKMIFLQWQALQSYLAKAVDTVHMRCP